jgi:hypothetical protein
MTEAPMLWAKAERDRLPRLVALYVSSAYRAWPAPLRRVSLDTLKQRFNSGLENSQYLIALSRARI